ncbi:MAG: hypothetical protein IH598_16600 [Bacteroidales bacterium]|nr:hypothetical protein [Bacteroidales bacterium]
MLTIHGVTFSETVESPRECNQAITKLSTSSTFANDSRGDFTRSDINSELIIHVYTGFGWVFYHAAPRPNTEFIYQDIFNAGF